jgi:hypothetical protein
MVAMMLTPLALAQRIELKNNDKFKTFEVELTTAPGDNVEMEFIPSEDNPRKIIGSHDENMAEYKITVDGTEYLLGVDFTYTGYASWTIWEPVMPLVIPPILSPGRMVTLDVKYMYTFLPASGIEGTIKMHAKGTSEGSLVNMLINEEMMITSLQGTGDLQNVNIQAVGGLGPSHRGIVSGWPLPPP